jgi:hypothetical protein
MGTKMAPSYGNIFMGKLEKLIIQYAPYMPISCFHFIDDVDMKRTDSEENLNRFFDHANNVHPTIKFTHEASRNNISFLDTYTICKNGIMSTDIYNKPTDKHQYLSPQSCHPKLCTKSIRTAKLSESNASAPMNKLQRKTAWGTEISSDKEGIQQCEH